MRRREEGWDGGWGEQHVQRPRSWREPFSLEDTNAMELGRNRMPVFAVSRSISGEVWHEMRERVCKHWMGWWKQGLCYYLASSVPRCLVLSLLKSLGSACLSLTSVLPSLKPMMTGRVGISGALAGSPLCQTLHRCYLISPSLSSIWVM